MTMLKDVNEALEMVVEKARERRQKLLELYETGDYTLEDLGRLEGVHKSKIFRLIAKARKEKA